MRRTLQNQYAIAQACLDSLACLSWCLSEFYQNNIPKVDHEEDKRLLCPLLTGKTVFWFIFTYRTWVCMLAAGHFFKQSVFTIRNLPLDRGWFLGVGHLASFICAGLAAFVHGMAFEQVIVFPSDILSSCFEHYDLSVRYGHLIGLVKVSVVVYITTAYVIPGGVTLYAYNLMTSTLKDSYTPFHQKAHNELKKIFYMDCLLFLLASTPHMIGLGVSHFTSTLTFATTEVIYKLSSYPILIYLTFFPLLAFYLGRKYDEHIVAETGKKYSTPRGPFQSRSKRRIHVGGNLE